MCSGPSGETGQWVEVTFEYLRVCARKMGVLEMGRRRRWTENWREMGGDRHKGRDTQTQRQIQTNIQRHRDIQRWR